MFLISLFLFDALKNERDVIKVRIEKRALGTIVPQNVIERERAFAEAVCLLRNNGTSDKYQGVIINKGLVIPHERAVGNIMDTAASGVNPLFSASAISKIAFMSLLMTDNLSE